MELKQLLQLSNQLEAELQFDINAVLQDIQETYTQKEWIGQDQSDLRVMEFNLSSLQEQQDESCYSSPFYRVALIKDIIDYYSPDLILMQGFHLKIEHLFSMANIKTCAIYLKDGLSISWSSRKFQLIQKWQINLFNERNRDFVRMISDKKQALVVLLRSKQNQRYILVVNIALSYEEDRKPFLQLQKLATLFQFIEQIKNQYKNLPIIFSGDFNIAPSNPLYEFILKGQEDFNQYPMQWSSQTFNPFPKNQQEFNYQAQMADQKQVKKERDNNWIKQFINFIRQIQIGETSNNKQLYLNYVRLRHEAIENPLLFNFDIQFESAYKTIQKVEPYPTYTDQNIYGTCDYIFYRNLNCVGVLKLENYDQLKFYDTFPNELYPSPHHFLLSQFEWLSI